MKGRALQAENLAPSITVLLFQGYPPSQTTVTERVPHPEWAAEKPRRSLGNPAVYYRSASTGSLGLPHGNVLCLLLREPLHLP